MRLIIAGGRSLHASPESIEFYVWQNLLEPTSIVSGGARGIDASGESYAQTKGLLLTRFRADWSAHGGAAGPIRNREMAKYGDVLLAFWDGESKGTANMIKEMKMLGKPVHIVKLSNDGV